MAKTESGFNLQAIVDQYLNRLGKLRAAVISGHAGLVHLSEADWEQYRTSLPPESGQGNSRNFSASERLGRSWLAANALKDLLALQAIYLEQIRQLLEVVTGSRLPLSDEAKSQEILRRIQDKPPTLEAMMVKLGEQLPEGFPRQNELESLGRLFRAFAAQSAEIPAPAFGENALATLCRPVVTAAPAAGKQSIPFKTETATISLQSPEALVVSKELLYLIFFTAFIIGRDVAEAVQLFVKSQSVPPPSDPISPSI